MTGFSELSSEVLLEGPVVSMTTSTFRTPDGGQIERQIVRHPGAVVIVPITDTGSVMLVRQFRAALGTDLLELPAGKLDVPGEAPAAAAERELIEEIGRQPGRLDPLVDFHNSPGFCDEFSHLFLARDMVAVDSAPDGVEEQFSTVLEVPLAEIPAMIGDGRITDAKTILGLLLVLSSGPWPNLLDPSSAGH